MWAMILTERMQVSYTLLQVLFDNAWYQLYCLHMVHSYSMIIYITYSPFQICVKGCTYWIDLTVVGLKEVRFPSLAWSITVSQDLLCRYEILRGSCPSTPVNWCNLGACYRQPQITLVLTVLHATILQEGNKGKGWKFSQTYPRSPTISTLRNGLILYQHKHANSFNVRHGCLSTSHWKYRFVSLHFALVVVGTM